MNWAIHTVTPKLRFVRYWQTICATFLKLNKKKHKAIIYSKTNSQNILFTLMCNWTNDKSHLIHCAHINCVALNSSKQLCWVDFLWHFLAIFDGISHSAHFGYVLKPTMKEKRTIPFTLNEVFGWKVKVLCR